MLQTSFETLVDFNSSMVRLKEFFKSICGVKSVFQFQYGAIKRQVIETEDQTDLKFQFQYGAIKSV